MTPAQFIAWRSGLGFSRTRAAEALGLSFSQLTDYETGCTRGVNSRPVVIPKHVALACAAISRGLTEQDALQSPPEGISKPRGNSRT